MALRRRFRDSRPYVPDLARATDVRQRDGLADRYAFDTGRSLARPSQCARSLACRAFFSGHTTSVDRKWAQGNKCIRIHFGEKKCAGIPWHLLCGFFGEERFGQRRNRGAGRLGQVGKRYVFFGGAQESPMRNFTGKMILRGAPVYTPLMRSMISLAASSPMMESGRSMSVMRGSR